MTRLPLCCAETTYVRRLAELHRRPSSTVRCCVALHSSGPKGKWSRPFSPHSDSFHPTVLLEKALSVASGPAVSRSGVRADLLRGRGAPIQSVIKHTAHGCHLADPAALSVPVTRLGPPSPASHQTERRYLWPCVISLRVSSHQHAGLNSKHRQPGWTRDVCMLVYVFVFMSDAPLAI